MFWRFRVSKDGSSVLLCRRGNLHYIIPLVFLCSLRLRRVHYPKTVLNDQPGKLFTVDQFDRDTLVLFIAFCFGNRLAAEVPRCDYHSKRYPLRALFDSPDQLANNINAYRRFRMIMLCLNAHNLPEGTRYKERCIDINALVFIPRHYFSVNCL